MKCKRCGDNVTTGPTGYRGCETCGTEHPFDDRETCLAEIRESIGNLDWVRDQLDEDQFDIQNLKRIIRDASAIIKTFSIELYEQVEPKK